MTIDLGPLQLDEDDLFAQLRQDLKDDWFPDPLAYEDMIGTGQVRDAILANIERNQGDYDASPSSVFNIPKPNFTLRHGLETGLPDRVLYHGLVSGLVRYYDPLLPWSVFNHRARVDLHRRSRRYLFNNPIESWGNFLGTAREALRTSPALLSTDLSNFYEHIDIGILETALIRLLPEIDASPAIKAGVRTRVRILMTSLRTWSHAQSRGLPQNRDASSFLANMYMLAVDRAMSTAGYRYFRYMDDIIIACRDVYQARLALKHLTLALRQLGLSVNSGKTVICRPDDHQAIDQALDSGSPELQRLSSVWSTRALRPISRSFSELKSYTLQLLSAHQTNSRPFRFCVRRLEVLAKCREFSIPPAYFAEITPLMIEALDSNPASTDQIVQYLRAAPTEDGDLQQVAMFLMDDARNVYSWQCYRLWLLLVSKRYTNANLIDFALRLIRTGEDRPDRSGAALYLGALGDQDTRAVVAEGFRQTTSYLGQRSFVIATQELPYRVVREHMQPTMRSDLVGAYRNLKGNGTYIAEPEPEPITSFIDLGRDYD